MIAATRVRAFFDPQTKTVTYVVADHACRRAAVIDPVLDFDLRSGTTSTHSSDAVLAYLRAFDLQLDWILETHVHADHLTGAAYLRRQAGGRIAIGAGVCGTQTTFKSVFNLDDAFVADGRQFDRLFDDGDTFEIGRLRATALHVPGHTATDVAYLIDGAVFVGDTLFMPDVGTARTDFPGGDARQLYRSIARLLALPAETVMYVCHDYPPGDRGAAWQTTVADQRSRNVHVRHGTSEDDFVSMRRARDATLDVPQLMLPAVQVNVSAGDLPEPDCNGVRYLRIPLGGQAAASPSHATTRCSADALPRA